MPHIRRLSQTLVNKIAAGEVIERPASVVKELMENAVDAGATRIDVAIEGGGAEMIRVVDNGGGIAAGELELAVASHATSKLASADDLFRVGTLGFRGEALASIASVSRLCIRSRTAEAESGAEIEVVGGEASGVSPYGCPVGTAVEIRDLFFNTPVRRKFLRATQTEMGHTTEAFTRIALAAPQIHFTLRHNDRQVFDLPAGEAWLERIALVAGRGLADNLIRVESADGEVQLTGYVAHPSQSRSNNRMQYLFLNGRYIRDRALQHALGEAYRGLLMTGRYPIAFLWLVMPPEVVDVNVHPTKLEVRFQDSGRLYSQLLSTLRTKFLSTDLTTRAELPPDDDPTGAHDQEQTAQLRQRMVDWAKGEVASWGTPRATGADSAEQGTLRADGDLPRAEPLELTRLD
ncbi:MAG: DNA mismatch repair endonuclease MutL, partial [Planctomycetota bacterium]